MAILTDDQIAQVAVNNGFPTTDSNNFAVCIAIAKAESSGRTDAVNHNTDGSTDKGLWQINSVHDDMMSGQDRFDPNVNARLMMLISNNGSNWQPWSTYTNGAYQNFIPEALSAIGGKQYKPDPNHTLGGASGSGNTETVGTDTANPVQGIENFFKILSSPDTWIRFAQVWGGAILIGLGILIYFREPITNAVEKGAKVAEVAAI